jgi:hypothetical protein
MVKLKHIRFNKTVKNNKNRQLIRFFLGYKSNQNKRTHKKYIFPLSGYTRRHNNRKINIHKKNNINNINTNYTSNATRKTKIAMPKFAPRFTIKRRLTQPNIETNNSNNSNNIIVANNDNVKKQLLLKQYIRNKALKHKRMQNLNQPNTYNKNKTPIYNSYVPGSGIGASNIATRRLKKKFAYLN